MDSARIPRASKLLICGLFQKGRVLAQDGDVPEIYQTTARYPANYLIDCEGRLQPAPSTEQPFENLVVAVDALLKQQIIRR